MKLLRILFRNKETESVNVYEEWEVRWKSRFGEYSGNTRPEVRVFPSKKDAESFKTALDDAFKLIKNTSENGTVTITKQAL